MKASMCLRVYAPFEARVLVPRLQDGMRRAIPGVRARVERPLVDALHADEQDRCPDALAR